MAKRLLFNVLVKVLGEFIELNEKDLNLAVWNGQIVLHNLVLKTDKLLRDHSLNIVHGTIATLEITIPWATLLVNPVKIRIDGIYLQVGPLDLAELDEARKEEVLKRMHIEKIHRLDMLDEMEEMSSSMSSEG